MIKKIHCYDDCDVYMNKNEIQPLGFDKNKSFGEMLDIASLYKCNIICRNGGGKWYLKKGDYDISKEKIKSNIGKYPKIKCWLIKYYDIPEK